MGTPLSTVKLKLTPEQMEAIKKEFGAELHELLINSENLDRLKVVPAERTAIAHRDVAN